jgi:hypothetical protein
VISDEERERALGDVRLSQRLELQSTRLGCAPWGNISGSGPATAAAATVATTVPTQTKVTTSSQGLRRSGTIAQVGGHTRIQKPLVANSSPTGAGQMCRAAESEAPQETNNWRRGEERRQEQEVGCSKDERGGLCLVRVGRRRYLGMGTTDPGGGGGGAASSGGRGVVVGRRRAGGERANGREAHY